jgi:HSP20 family protein
MLVRVRRYPTINFPSVLDFGRDMNELLETFLHGPEMRDSPRSFPMDIVEEKDRYLVVAELPGIRKEDLKISLEDGHVTISTERKSEEVPEKAVWLRNEITFGQFSRTIPVPGEVKVDEITAELANGVLQVILPKSEKARVREITVK